MPEEAFKSRYLEFDERYRKAYNRGLNVSRIKELANKAAQLYEEGDHAAAEERIEKALKALGEVEKPPRDIRTVLTPVMILAVLVAAAWFVWKSIPEKETCQTYTSPEGTSIKYPLGWVRLNQTEEEIYDGDVLWRVVLQPPEHKDLMLSILCARAKAGQNTSAKEAAEQYYETISGGIKLEELGADVRMQKIQSKPIPIGDADGHEIEAAIVSRGSMVYKMKTAAAVKGGLVCYVLYAGEIGHYSRYAEEIDQYIKSMKISG